MKDDIYTNVNSAKGSFTFDKSVVPVFEDMIKRSVPGYELTLEMIGVIAKHTLSGKTGSLALDLGCSLGASMCAVMQNSNAQVIGIDNSADMLRKANSEMSASFKGRFTLIEDDIKDYILPEATDLIILNFTLQFIPLRERLNLIQRCYASLISGGVLLISEKVFFENSHKNELLNTLHHQFKQNKGYSFKEIINKRDAIENVLVAETVDTHLKRLACAGFPNPTCWYQCFNFASFIAVKD